jgi:hypothetical protein
MRSAPLQARPTSLSSRVPAQGCSAWISPPGCLCSRRPPEHAAHAARASAPGAGATGPPGRGGPGAGRPRRTPSRRARSAAPRASRGTGARPADRTLPRRRPAASPALSAQPDCVLHAVGSPDTLLGTSVAQDGINKQLLCSRHAASAAAAAAAAPRSELLSKATHQQLCGSGTPVRGEHIPCRQRPLRSCSTPVEERRPADRARCLPLTQRRTCCSTRWRLRVRSACLQQA